MGLHIAIIPGGQSGHFHVNDSHLHRPLKFSLTKFEARRKLKVATFEAVGDRGER
jgi:hypothetical protein